MDLSKFLWIRKPHQFHLTNQELEIVTEPHTDLWQRTYYHFQNDNAPIFYIKTDEKYFSFCVQTQFADSHHRFDQCGIVLYLDSQNWIKASVEYENESFQHLGSVVTNHGYSDWWYRFSRREDDYCVECSFDGNNYQQMRICHLNEGNQTIQIGVYACSPENSSFKAKFTNFQWLDCQWKAHDGQQPDKTK